MRYSVKAINHALMTFLFETFNGRYQRHEYQWKITQCEDRYIVCSIKQNNSLSLCDITNIVNNKIDIPISMTTLQW